MLKRKNEKHWALNIKTSEHFIELRNSELFDNSDWLSPRHLANIESWKNWISIEKLILLSTALEENPVDLFSEYIHTYREGKILFNLPTIHSLPPPCFSPLKEL